MAVKAPVTASNMEWVHLVAGFQCISNLLERENGDVHAA